METAVERTVFSLTGSVGVIKKSERSLYRPRIPITEIGAALDTRNTPWNGN